MPSRKLIDGFDCYGPLDAATIERAVAAGFRFVGRYYGSGKKVMQREEAERISAAGLSLIVYFERTAMRALGGRSAGLTDGAMALRQAQEVGQPRGTVIYATVDFDAAATSNDTIKDYFAGFAAALGSDYRVGVYAGGAVCQLLLDAGLAKCSVLAGAMGWRGSRAFLGKETVRQYPEAKPGEAGNPLLISIDRLECESLEEAGAWRRAAEPVHQPVRLGDKGEDVRELQRRLIAKGFDVGPSGADGHYGPKTDAAFWAWAWTELSR